MRLLVWGGQFVVGATAYGLLELVWRGYTHISMLILGGLCLPVLTSISASRAHPVVQCAGGSFFITAAEFATGCIVNLWLGLDVWDYGMESLHLLGQICPRFTLLWFALCAVLLPGIRAMRAWRLRPPQWMHPPHKGLPPIIQGHLSDPAPSEAIDRA